MPGSAWPGVALGDQTGSACAGAELVKEECDACAARRLREQRQKLFLDSERVECEMQLLIQMESQRSGNKTLST